MKAAPPKSASSDAFDGQDWSLFLGVSVIWGSSFLLIAYSLEGFTPGAVTLGRVGLGAAVLWLIRWFGGSGGSIERQDRLRIVFLGAVWVAVPFTMFPLAQEHINSAVAGLLNGATPIFAAVVSTVMLKIAPRGAQLAGLVVGFIGITLVSLGSGSGRSELFAVVMVLAAAVCYGIAINAAVPLQAKYGSVVTMSAVLTVATVLVAPFGFYGSSDIEWRVQPTLTLVVLGAIGTGVAYWIMASLVGQVGSIRASFITYLIPVISLVLGVVFRQDEVTPIALFGAILTIGGALLASRRLSARPK